MILAVLRVKLERVEHRVCWCVQAAETMKGFPASASRVDAAPVARVTEEVDAIGQMETWLMRRWSFTFFTVRPHADVVDAQSTDASAFATSST